MISYDEALQRALDGVPHPARERVSVTDAVGRVLTDDVTARVALPAFDHSSMDGWAVATRAFSGDGPWTLPIEGESRAGAEGLAPLRDGSAMRIFTGAPLPRGADAVVPQEDASRDGDLVRFERVPAVNAFVRRRGDDVSLGGAFARAGTRVTPWHVAAFTAAEVPSVCVARRPRVSILATGDELREAGEPPSQRSVADAITPALAALVRRLGGEPRVLPFARDEATATRDAVTDALRGADLVLTVGGVSVGDHDPCAARSSPRASRSTSGVAIKPGKPLCLGHAPDGARVLGLPGNPSSALLTFALFGAPLLRAMQGERRVQPPPLRRDARARDHPPAGRREFYRVTLDDDSDGLPVATPLANQASGSALSLAAADALMDVPAAVTHLPAGATVRCFWLRDV
ncbi:MAG: molybdopterin molybdotransferase MoeA [Polyangiales bacterium]